jgi:hypothetical protein
VNTVVSGVRRGPQHNENQDIGDRLWLVHLPNGLREKLGCPEDDIESLARTVAHNMKNCEYSHMGNLVAHLMSQLVFELGEQVWPTGRGAVSRRIEPLFGSDKVSVR